MQQKILKTGNSLGITIPSDFVKTFGLKAGTSVEVHPDISTAIITVTFPTSSQLPLLPR